MKELTDAECDAFRRLPLPFNGMVRTIYAAGAEAQLARYADEVARQGRRLEMLNQEQAEMLERVASLEALVRSHGIDVP